MVYAPRELKVSGFSARVRAKVPRDPNPGEGGWARAARGGRYGPRPCPARRASVARLGIEARLWSYCTIRMRPSAPAASLCSLAAAAADCSALNDKPANHCAPSDSLVIGGIRSAV